MSSNAKKATLLSSLGAGLEYYDFIIYGMMAEQLSTLFFASSEPWIALVKTFAVFAVGYLARPIGGILFGMLGDTLGRKKAFLTVMMLMAFSTLTIGLLPTYAQIGSIATFLLVLMRVLQGLSYGAELPGAITIVLEYTEKHKQATYSGMVISSVTLGSIAAAFILYLMSQEVGKEQILSWAWRIPFLFGGSLAVVNYFIRKHLQETPEFLCMQKERREISFKTPLHTLVRDHLTQIVLGIGMNWFAASLVIFTLYLPTYLSEYFHYTPSDVYLAMTWGLGWSALMLPICGRMGDRFGKTTVFVAACLAFTLGGFLLFDILHFGGWGALMAFIMFYQTINACLFTSYFPLISAAFPTAARYTGIAACYNITYSLMGCLPLVLTGLITYTHSADIAIWILIGNSLLSATSVLLLANKHKLTTEKRLRTQREQAKATPVLH